MINDRLEFFELAERRLGWLDRRQVLLAQNVANANTPGYISKDLKPFAPALAEASRTLAVTNPGHLPGLADQLGSAYPLRPSERAPDGNAVSLNDQLIRVADTNGAQALVGNLYHRYLGFFHIAIGK